jgi:hypothetical protein
LDIVFTDKRHYHLCLNRGIDAGRVDASTQTGRRARFNYSLASVFPFLSRHCFARNNIAHVHAKYVPGQAAEVRTMLNESISNRGPLPDLPQAGHPARELPSI